MGLTKKSFAAHFGLFVAFTAAMWLFLIIAAGIPNRMLSENMTKSALSYKEEDAFSFQYKNKWCSVTDNYADSILLNVSWNMGRGNPFKASLDTGYYSGGQYGENAGLYLTVSEDVPPDTEYTRYWHGCGGILRILHMFTSVNVIKVMGLIVTLIFALLTLALLIRQKNYKTAFSLLVGICMVQLWNVGLSLEYQSVFILCFMLCPLYLHCERRKETALYYLSVAGGTLTAFFDFLTCETVVILLPLVLVCSVRLEEGRLGESRENVRLLIRCLLSFGLCYVGAFFTKWTLATVVTGENKFIPALDQAALRVAGDGIQTSPNPFVRGFLALIANLSTLFGAEKRADLSYAVIGTFLFACLGGSLYYLFRKKEQAKGKWLLLCLGGIVFLRYLVLGNHSYLHGFFTYRALITPLTALCAYWLLGMEWRKGRGKKHG